MWINARLASFDRYTSSQLLNKGAPEAADVMVRWRQLRSATPVESTEEAPETTEAE